MQNALFYISINIVEYRKSCIYIYCIYIKRRDIG